MIGFLEGVVHSIRGTYCIVSVSGIGYKVFTTKQALLALSPGKPVSFWTHLAIRETAHDLYGFAAEEELRFFEMLLTVSGIGPKSGLAILDIASVETLRSAIAHGKAEYMTKVSGIGRKTAEKIVVELREKVGAPDEATSAAMKGDHEALEALKSLGYSQEEARNALRKVPARHEKSNERLREALKILGTHD